MRSGRLVAAILMAAALTGCSTVYDADGNTPLGEDGPHVYGGVRTIFQNGGFVKGYFEFGPHPEWESTPPVELAAILVAPVAADIAFSLAADTLILPYTLARALSRKQGTRQGR